jgi:hypothetical protein
LDKDVLFLDVGAGDCSLALAVAERVGVVHAVEVSPGVVADAPKRDNLQLHLTDGISVPLPRCSVTLAHSNEVLEHIHPEDALEHMRGLRSAGPRWEICVCDAEPSYGSGRYLKGILTRKTTGFHLREYTVTELAMLMRRAGFAPEVWTTRKGVSVRLPLLLIRAVE